MKTADLILLRLKNLGPHSAKMLSDALDMTTMGVRQHMQLLEHKELICYEDVRTKVGRPTRFWSLTEDGHAQFSDRHDILARSLITSVTQIFGEEGLDKMIKHREDGLYSIYYDALQSCYSTRDKLEKFVKLRQQGGYMAELIEQDNLFLIVENHCPICVAAKSCSQLCQSELSLFNRLLGDTMYVERTAHIIAGSRHCAYLIKPLE